MQNKSTKDVRLINRTTVGAEKQNPGALKAKVKAAG